MPSIHKFNFRMGLLYTLCIQVWIINVISGENQPHLVWTQQSHQWTKLKVIAGDPGSWVSNDDVKVMGVLPQRGQWHAVTFDPVTQHVYWSDSTRQTISRLHLSELDSSIETVLKYKGEVGGLAMDWKSGNVYFTNKTANTIMLTTNHDERTDIYREVVAAAGGSELLGGIAIHVENRRVYWASRTGDTRTQIEVADLNGPNGTVAKRKTLLDSRNQIIGFPVHLSLDEKMNTLYWVDDGSSKMYSYDLTKKTLAPNTMKHQYTRMSAFGDYRFFAYNDNLSVIVENNHGELLHSFSLDAVPQDIIIVGHGRTDLTICPGLCAHICVFHTTSVAECLCSDADRDKFGSMDNTTCKADDDEFAWWWILLAALLLALLLGLLLATLIVRRTKKKTPSPPRETEPPIETAVPAIYSEADAPPQYINTAMLVGEQPEIIVAPDTSPQPEPGLNSPPPFAPPTTPPWAEDGHYANGGVHEALDKTDSGVSVTGSETPMERPPSVGAVAAPGALTGAAAIAAAADNLRRKREARGDPDAESGNRFSRFFRKTLRSLRHPGAGGERKRPAIPSVYRDQDNLTHEHDGDGGEAQLGAQNKKALYNRKIEPKPQLHRLPRGYAPASRSVPTQVKSTWGRTKNKMVGDLKI